MQPTAARKVPKRDHIRRMPNLTNAWLRGAKGRQDFLVGREAAGYTPVVPQFAQQLTAGHVPKPETAFLPAHVDRHHLFAVGRKNTGIQIAIILIGKAVQRFSSRNLPDPEAIVTHGKERFAVG